MGVRAERKWIASDGTAHNSKQEAQAHDAQAGLIKWCEANDLSNVEEVVVALSTDASALMGVLKQFAQAPKRKRRTKAEMAAAQASAAA